MNSRSFEVCLESKIPILQAVGCAEYSCEAVLGVEVKNRRPLSTVDAEE
jgi:hypothetical protein